jgi:hypothetical protein
MDQSFPPDNLKALRSIAEARHILTEVVTSSESFDYRKAKEGLLHLDRIIRELGREEARLRAIGNTSDCAKVVPFPLERTAS